MLHSEKNLVRGKHAHVAAKMHGERDIMMFLLSTANDLMGCAVEKIDLILNDALLGFSRYIAADRSALYMLDGTQEHLQMHHEWCRQGISPHVQQCRTLALDSLPVMAELLQQDGAVSIVNVADVAENPIRELWFTQGIETLLLMPLWRDQQPVGMMFFEFMHEYAGMSEFTSQMLPIFIQMTGNAIGRKSAENVCESPGDSSKEMCEQDFNYAELIHPDDLEFVAAQKESEMESTAYQKRLQQVIDGTRAGIWQWNVQTGETWFNEHWANMLGYTLDELRPLSIDTWVQLAHPLDLEKSHRLLQQHFSGKLDYYEFESRMQHKDGHWIWVMDRGQVTTWTDDGQPLLMSGTHMDITEKKEVEEKLREKTNELEALYKGLNDAVIIADIETRKVVSCNAVAEKLIGKSADEILHTTIEELHPSDILEQTRFRFNLQALGLMKIVETEILARNDKRIPVTISSSIIEYHGRQCLMRVVQDISELKDAAEKNRRLQQQLENAKKLETLGVLAGGIAHNFNNILTPIIGFTELAKAQLPEQSPAIAADLDIVLKSAERARKLVRQMMAFSRQAPPEMKRQKLKPIVRESLLFLKESLFSSIAITKRTEEFDEIVNCDAGQIQQVVMNLCTNSEHAMESNKGKLLVDLKKIYLKKPVKMALGSLQAGQWYALLRVCDMGKGMTKNEQKKIFDPFYTTKETGKGTGLGLSIAYGIIKAHEGVINIVSRKDRGTIVSVYLPIAH